MSPIRSAWVRRVAVRGMVVLLAGMLLSGCMVKVGYNNLDRLARWQLGEFVDLTSEQRQIFDEEFALLWYWHRTTQLPEYAVFFDALAAETRKAPPNEERLEEIFAQFTRWGDRLEREMVPFAVALLASLSDAQVDELLVRMREDRGWRDTESDDEVGQRRAWVEQMEDRTENLVGRLSGAQVGMFESRAERYVPEQALWEAYIDAWQSDFAALLKERREPGFAEEFLLLVATEDYGDPLNEVYLGNEALSREALAAVFDSLSERQRAHLEDRLAGLAKDFRELVEDAPRYVPEGAAITQAEVD